MAPTGAERVATEGHDALITTAALAAKRRAYPMGPMHRAHAVPETDVRIRTVEQVAHLWSVRARHVTPMPIAAPRTRFARVEDVP
jgi:hypothetical protein